MRACRDRFGRLRLAVLLAAVCSTAQAQPPAVVPTFTVQTPLRATLPNGLRILYIPDSRAPFFEARLVLNHAASHLSASDVAYMPLLRAMIPYGTSTMSRASVQTNLEGLGVSLDVGLGPTDVDGRTSSVRVAGLASDAPAVLQLLRTIVESPAIRTADVESVVQARMRQLQPANNMDMWSLDRALLMSRSTNLSAASDSAALADPRLAERLRALHPLAFRPDAAWLVVTGPFTWQDVQQWATTSFASWRPSGPTRNAGPALSACTAVPDARTLPAFDSLVSGTTAQTSIALAAPIASSTGEDHAKLAVIATLLRNRLAERSRAESWQRYTPRMAVSRWPCSRTLVLHVSVQASQAALATRAMREVVHALQSVPVTEAELDIASSTAAMLRLTEAVSSRQLVDHVLVREVNGDPAYWDSYAGSLARMNGEIVREFAARHLSSGAHIWVVAGDANGVQSALGTARR